MSAVTEDIAKYCSFVHYCGHGSSAETLSRILLPVGESNCKLCTVIILTRHPVRLAIEEKEDRRRFRRQL